jgi:hypothetical protein
MQAKGTLCYGLSRILGMVGFMLGGGIVFAVAASLLHVHIEAQSLREMSPKEIVVGVGAVLGGFLGLIFGKAAGYSIKVTDDRVSAAIDGFWHFGANAVLVWLPVIGTILGLIMGRTAVRTFRSTHSMGEMWWLGFAIPVLLGWSVAFLYWVPTRLFPQVGCILIPLLVNFGPIILCAVAGDYEARQLGLNHRWGWIAAVVPFLLIPASLQSIKQDAHRRLAG